MADNKLNYDAINQFANLSKIQKHQMTKAETRMKNVKENLENLEIRNDEQSDFLDELLLEAESLSNQGVKAKLNQANINDASSLTKEEEQTIEIEHPVFEDLSFVKYTDDWEDFLNNNYAYASEFNINLTEDPFETLLSDEYRNEIQNRVERNYKFEKLNLDKYDYMYSSMSGILCGFIDVLFVGSPLKGVNTFSKSQVEKFKKNPKYTRSEDSFLVELSHKSTDKIVIQFAKLTKKTTGSTRPVNNIVQAISFLEDKFSVPYDARYKSDLKNVTDDINFNPSNHHLKSWAHSPDLLGLLFSLIDQFRNTTTIIDAGKITIAENNGSYELRGRTFITKIISGVVNWLGHVMSDIAGASGTRRKGRAGAGLPLPFYNFFQMINVNVAKDKDDIQYTFAKITETIYKFGYDARFGGALAIPVVLNELLIRILWTIREVYGNKKPASKILEVNKSREVNRLLLVGHGALCTVDGIDAFAKSGGMNYVLLLSRMNLIGWTRFGLASYKEVTNIYKFSGIDIEKLDDDLEEEWKRMIPTN